MVGFCDGGYLGGSDFEENYSVIKESKMIFISL